MTTVVTATRLEYAAVRKALPLDVEVRLAGICLSRDRTRIAGAAISCGLAGGLRADLPTGAVLVPRTVRRPDGTMLECESHLVHRLAGAARSLGFDPVEAPLLTTSAIVNGPERETWAAQGYAGADMETGLITADAVGCVRVVLDTPAREISAAWANPKTAIFHPAAWFDVPFLGREGPRCARIAAAVIARALRNSEAR